MKFIHTADWHLGNKMHEVERTKEFENFFNWLKNTIIEEKAEALVVAGDIFDTANPPTEAKAMYIKFLASLIGSDCRNIIIVGGNHDSGSLLDSEKPLLEYLNIHVVGSVANIKAEDMVFELVDKDNKPCCICCAIPYAHEIELRKYFDENSETGYYVDKDVNDGKIYDCSLLPNQIVEYLDLDGKKIPLQSVDLWCKYYELMGRDEKVQLIKKVKF